jgi:hypothetical protein
MNITNKYIITFNSEFSLAEQEQKPMIKFLAYLLRQEGINEKFSEDE